MFDKDPKINEFYLVIPFEENRYVVIDNETLSYITNERFGLRSFYLISVFNEKEGEIFESEEQRRINEILLDSVYSKVPFLNEFYLSAKKNSKLDKIIALIDSGTFPGFSEHIKTAFSQVSMSEVLFTSNEDQQKLGRIFERYFEPEETTRQHVKICSEHCDKIFNTFDINNKSDKEKATYLLIIATIFVKLSSKSMFGTENSSPEALRNYAGALINTAFELSPTFISEPMKSEWIGRLFGLEIPNSLGNHYFDCTDILSDMMRDELLKLDPDLMGSLYPGVW